MPSPPSRPSTLGAVFGLIAAVLFAVAPAAGAEVATPQLVGAEPLSCLNNALTAYAESGDRWTGADSTFSTPLPDGREVFAFSDTFLAPLTTSTRQLDAPFVHNTLVVRDAERRWSTVSGGTLDDPAALLSPDDPEHWYWVGAATYLDDALQIPLTEWRSTGPGPLDFALVGSSLARFDTDDLHTPVSISPLPRSRGIQWGQWVQPDDGWTYVYGIEADGDDKHLHVARVPGADLRQPFSFWTGWAWLPWEAQSSRIADDVYAELSVHRVRPGTYMLTTMQGGIAFSGRLTGRFGPTPAGPFGPPITLYTTPETGASGIYHDSDVYTYNAHVHPEYSTPDQLVISYNVNSLDDAPGGDVYRDASIYRPRFIMVTLSWPDGMDGEPARLAC